MINNKLIFVFLFNFNIPFFDLYTTFESQLKFLDDITLFADTSIGDTSLRWFSPTRILRFNFDPKLL